MKKYLFTKEESEKIIEELKLLAKIIAKDQVLDPPEAFISIIEIAVLSGALHIVEDIKKKYE